MPGNGFWLLLTLGAIALSFWNQGLFLPLIWGLLCSAFYLFRVKAAGTAAKVSVAFFTVISITAFVSLIHFAIHYLTST